MDSSSLLRILMSGNGSTDVTHASQSGEGHNQLTNEIHLSESLDDPSLTHAASDDFEPKLVWFTDDSEESSDFNLVNSRERPYVSILVQDGRVPYRGGNRPARSRDAQPFRFYEERHFMPESNDCFFPLNIGDILSGGLKIEGEYEIVRKLGCGAFGVVWLALWTSSCGRKQRYLALKVLSKETSRLIETRENKEYEVFEHLSIATSVRQAHHPGYKHCMTLVDSFPHYCTEEETFGTYTIFVMEPCGQNLDRLLRHQPDGHFNLSVTKKIVKQSLQALDYMHREKGLIHGDLKLDNFLVALNTSRKTLSDLVKNDPPKSYPPQIAPQFSKEPIRTVKSQSLPNLGLDDNLEGIKIKLSDYSLAISPDKVTKDTHLQIPWFMAPEVALRHKSVTTAIDIWSLGCIIFQCLTGEMLFDLWTLEKQNVLDTLLASIVEQIGVFPPDFLDLCERKNSFFDGQGELKRVHRYEPQDFGERMKILETIPWEDIEPTAKFIRRCLSIDPSKRPSARELLQDERLRDVAV